MSIAECPVDLCEPYQSAEVGHSAAVDGQKIANVLRGRGRPDVHPKRPHQREGTGVFAGRIAAGLRTLFVVTFVLGIWSRSSAQNAAAPAGEGGSLEPLVADLVMAFAPQFLSDRILALSPDRGATTAPQKQAAIGAVWLHDARASKAGDRAVRLEAKLFGWQWVSRTTETLGAEFEVDQYAKFTGDLTLVGRVDTRYDSDRRVVTLSLAPTEPVHAAFRVTGGMQVRPEGLWSSIVGGVASLVGKSPEERGRETIRQETRQRMKARLDQGITVTLDLCTGQRHVWFGQQQPDESKPRSASQPGERVVVEQEAELHRVGLLVAGPFDSGGRLRAKIELHDRSGAVHVAWLCVEDAARVARAFAHGESPPKTFPLAEKTIENTDTVEIAKEASDCEAVLFMRPTPDIAAPIRYRYTITRQGGGPKPIIDCTRERDR